MKFKTDSDLLRAANEYLTSLHKLADKNAAAAKALQDTSRKALYASLAEGYGLCLAMLDPANAKAVAGFLSCRSIVAATGNSNPFFPLVKALYGKEEDPKAIPGVWVPNRSSFKYANVFRLAHQLGETPATFADWLFDFSDKDFGGGLTAAEKRDRRTNGANDPAAEAEIDRNINLVTAQPPLGTLSLDSDVPAGTKYVCVWGILDDAEFTAHGVLPGMSERVETYLRSKASELAAAIVKRRLVAEAETEKAKRKTAPPAKPAQRTNQREAVPA